MNGEIADGIAELNMDDDAFGQDLMKVVNDIGADRSAQIMQTAVIEEVEFRPVLAKPVALVEEPAQRMATPL